MDNRPAAPNVFCQKCGDTFPLPHTCGADKPAGLVKEPRDPNARPAAVKAVEDMDEEEVEVLRTQIARRDERNRVRGKVQEALVFAVGDIRMEPVGNWVKTGVISREEVGRIFLKVLDEWVVR